MLFSPEEPAVVFIDQLEVIPRRISLRENREPDLFSVEVQGELALPLNRHIDAVRAILIGNAGECLRRAGTIDRQGSLLQRLSILAQAPVDKASLNRPAQEKQKAHE